MWRVDIGEPGLPTFQTHWRLISIQTFLINCYFCTFWRVREWISWHLSLRIRYFLCVANKCKDPTCLCYELSYVPNHDPESFSSLIILCVPEKQVLRSGHGHLERLPRRGPDPDKPFALLPLQHHRESQEPIFEIKLMHKIQRLCHME